MIRARVFNIRFSEEEWRRLESLVSQQEVPAATVIRGLIKRAYEERAQKGLKK